MSALKKVKRPNDEFTEKMLLYLFQNQGTLDKDGVTTIYHELVHVKDMFDLDRNLSYPNAAIKAREGDYKIDSNGNIVEPRVYHAKSKAQLFGELVSRQSQKLKLKKEEMKKEIEYKILLIKLIMIQKGAL